MNKFFFLKVLMFYLSFAHSQVLRQHMVDSLDNINKIAEKYGVLKEQIIELNPNINDTIISGKIIVIPERVEKKGQRKEVRELVSYKTHITKRKETIYSISKKYGITIDELKESNKQLYDKPLMFKDKLYIPKFKKSTVFVPMKTLKLHQVSATESILSIAYKYGITFNQLLALNPQLDSLFIPGKFINVPNIDLDRNLNINENYFFYEILPHESLNSLLKKTGVKIDSLEKLNPFLKDIELFDEMVLKLPKNKNTEFDLRSVELNVTKKNSVTKSIALVLPFKANTIDFDLKKLAKKQIQNDGYINISIDFYTGVKTALDSIKKLGISVNFDVFDSELNSEKIRRIIKNTDFSKYDFVLGPMTFDNCILVSELLENHQTPIVSPFIEFDKLNNNLIQTIPNYKWVSNKFLSHIKKNYNPDRVLILTDNSSINRAKLIQSFFNNSEILITEFDKKGKEQFYFRLEKLKKEIIPGKNFIFLETENQALASNITSILSGLNGTKVKDLTTNSRYNTEISLLTTRFNNAFTGESISNFDLSNLSFKFPSVNYSNELNSSFKESYKEEYGSYPSKYAIRGFDLTFDLILRLVSTKSLSNELSENQTQYIENIFKYVKSEEGGFVNQSFFILKYDNLKVVKIQY